jgi:Zn-dependent alcohol dehydrogenase
MVARGDISADRFVTHKFKLDDICKGFETVEAGRGVKVLIDCE